MALNLELGDAASYCQEVQKAWIEREILRKKAAPGDDSEIRARGIEGDWGVGAPRLVHARVNPAADCLVR